MNKWLVTIGCGLIGVAFVLWFVSDDPLDAGVGEWLSYHREHQGTPGADFHYILGLDAPAGRDPVVAGREWYRLHQQNLEPDNLPTEWSVGRPWAHEARRLPETGRLRPLLDCRSRGEPGCERIAEILDEHAVVLERYKSWPTGEGFSRAAPDHWLVAPMQVLMRADLLARIEVIDALMNHQDAYAADLQVEAIERVRRYLAMSDSLLDLVVAIRLLSEHVDFLLHLQADGVLGEVDRTNVLRDLESVDDLLEQVMRGEFGLVFQAIEWLDERPDERTHGTVADRLIQRVFYRKNMTLNANHELYRWVASLDRPEKLSAVIAGNEPVWEKPVTLRNYAGYVHPTLLPEASGFLSYIARLHDLQGKLALGRSIDGGPVSDTELRGLVRINPYGRGYGVELDEADGRVCLSGPLEDNDGIRCIPIQR